MNCAPIIIPTLNRVEHLSRLLDSLKRNSLSKYTDVFIGLDFPPASTYELGYKKVCEYLQGDFSCFNSFNIIKRSENLGYLRNVEDLINEVLQLYDRFIYMDDDLELSPNFLEYMNKCLIEYEGHDEIIAVCGYSYPLKWNVEQNSTVFEQSFICPMWGTGFWAKKYRKIEENIVKDNGLRINARDIIIKGGLKRMTDICRQEFVDLCLSPDYNITLAAKVTDISLRMYMAAYDKCVIVPTISKVRNWGFDGTGEFCTVAKEGKESLNAKSYQYHSQEIDERKDFVLLQDHLCRTIDNKNLMSLFDPISMKARVKTVFKAMLFVLLGKELFEIMTLKLRELR